MAYIQLMTIYSFLLTLFAYQMLFGEGRQIRTPSGVRISYIVSPSPRGIRKLGSLTTKSDHDHISPTTTARQTSTIDYPQNLVNQNNFASFKPTPTSPRTSQIVGSFKANKEQSDEPGNCPDVTCLDNFRRTAPGHSPGAGHSFMANKNKSLDQTTKNPKGEYTQEESDDDYRRTSPGRSPGAGHPLEDGNKESTPESAELQTTFPSSSQAHRSFFTYSAVSRKNNFQPPSLPSTGVLATNQKFTDTAGLCGNEKCTYDFPPANPGDSHGADHSFVSKSDRITPEYDGAHLGGVQARAGQKDDYRPTTPGHSPGAGHAMLKENRIAP